jgi:hypothetical protein
MSIAYKDANGATITVKSSHDGSDEVPHHNVDTLPGTVQTDIAAINTAVTALAAIISGGALPTSEAHGAAIQTAVQALAAIISTGHLLVTDSNGAAINTAVTALAAIISSSKLAVSDATAQGKLDTIHTDLGTTLAGYLTTLAGAITSARMAVNVDSTTTGKLDTLHTDTAQLHTDLTTPPSTIYNGKKTVTTAGTRVTLASSQAITRGVWIRALTTNTGTIYVGDSSVSSSNGAQLTAGDALFLEVANLTTVNLDCSVNGEGVTYIAS